MLADVLARGLEAAIVAVFVALVLVVLWGVGSRFVLNAPSRWTEEVAIFLLMWLALLGAAIAFRRQQHLGVESLVGILHPSARLLMALVGQALIAFFALAVLVYGGSVLVLETLEAGQVTPATNLPMGYVYLAVPISGAFVVLFAIEQVVALLAVEQAVAPLARLSKAVDGDGGRPVPGAISSGPGIEEGR